MTQQFHFKLFTPEIFRYISTQNFYTHVYGNFIYSQKVEAVQVLRSIYIKSQETGTTDHYDVNCSSQPA